MSFYRNCIMVIRFFTLLISLVICNRLAEFIAWEFTHSAVVETLAGLATWLALGNYIINGRIWPFGSRKKEVYGTVPLKAWKVAKVIPIPAEALSGSAATSPTLRYWFEPVFATNRHYGVESAAECYRAPQASLPHEGHNCGFYAYMRRRGTRSQLFRPDGVVLEVELYGDVIEGSRHILRGAYQRVLSVRFIDLCEHCHGPLPRVAIGLARSRKNHIVPVCNRHAPDQPSQLLSPQAVAAGLGTEVCFRTIWLSRVSRWIYHS